MTRRARKRLLILAIGFTVIVAGLGGAYAYRQQRIKSSFAAMKATGLEAFAKQDYKTAVNTLGPYLHRFPNDVDVLVSYADARENVPAEGGQHIREVLSVLRNASVLKPDDVSIRRRLLEHYTTLGFNTEAIEVAAHLLSRDPADRDALRGRAIVQARLRRWAEANADIDAWMKVEPNSIEARQLKLSVAYQSGTPASELLAMARQWRTELPDKIEVELIEAESYLMSGDYATGRDQLMKLVERGAELPLEQRRLLASRLDAVGQVGDAISVLRKVADESNSQDDRTALFVRLWDAGVLAEAAVEGKKIDRDRVVASPRLAGLRAMALQVANETEAAAADAQILKDSQDPVAKAWLAALSLGKGDAASSVAVHRKTIEDGLAMSPNDPYLLNFLAETQRLSGDTESAIGSWQKAARANPRWPAPALRQIEPLVERGRYQQAFDAAGQAFQRSPAQGVVPLVRVWSLMIEGGLRDDLEALSRLIEDVNQRLPGVPEVQLAQVLVTARRGQTQAAVQLANTLLQPDNPATKNWTATHFTRLAAISQQYKLGVETAAVAAVKGRGDASPEAAISDAIARFLRDRDAAAAIAAFDAARPSTSDNTLAWQMGRLRVLELVGSPDALAAWKAITEANPDSLPVQQAALQSSVAWDDRELITRVIERVQSLAGDGATQWKVARARLALEGRPDDAAVKAAQQSLEAIVAHTPDSAEARYWLARALQLSGNPSAAIEQLEAAARLNPKASVIGLALAQALQQQGYFDRARGQLQRISNDVAAAEDQRRFAASLLARQGDAAGAIELLKRDGQNLDAAKDDLLLASLYLQQGDVARAEEMARSLLEKPTLAGVQFAADLYTQLRKPAEAQAALAKLAELPLGPGVRELAMADYALRYESLEKATEHLRAAIAAAPQSDGAWHALVRAEMLRGDLDAVFRVTEEGLSKVPDSTILKTVQTRRPLVTEGFGITSLRPLALGLVSDPTNDALAETLKAMLAFWKQPTDTSLVEVRRVADRHTREPVVQYAVIELYQALGRYEDAGTLAVRAAESFPAASEPPRLATQAFSAAGRWTQALGYADAWRALARGDVFDADLARGTAQLQLGRAEEAISTLAVHVPRAVTQPNEFANYLLTYASACVRTGRVGEAETALRPLLADNTRIRHGWISLVAELDRPADAARRIDELAAQFAASDPQTRAIVGLGRLRLAERTRDESLQKSAFEQIIAASQAPELDVDVLNVMASAMELAGRKDLAEQLYRRSLEKAPLQPIVKNNLAMLLVTRGETSESLRLAQEAVRQLPLMGTLWDTLATVAVAGNQPDLAIDAWQHAIDLDSTQPAWMVALAETQLKAGKRDDAIRTVALYDANASNAQLTDDLRRRIEAVRELLK